MNVISQNNSSNLFKTVINGGYCVGCGACAAVKDSPIKIELDQYSKLQATSTSLISSELDERLQAVCPFSDTSLNEDDLGKELYGDIGTYDSKLGYTIKSLAGYISENSYRELGSSGGMGSWILTELLQKGMVDAVIHVQDRIPTGKDARLFHYQLSTTPEQILLGAKSKYYPIELSEMMELIKSKPARYAIVGIPCFIKSVRLLSRQDTILNTRIKYCIGLICGHLKSTRFAEMFAWECGIKPSELKSIDFRTKLEGYDANKYGVTVTGIVNDKEVIRTSPPVYKMYGANWGLSFFKYKACDFCDDVVAETADITIGDAWLPRFIAESKGTNVVVIRHPEIDKIISAGIKEGRLNLDPIPNEEVIQSQSSGFNHRRAGLAYRLFLMDKQNKWRPKKRVVAENSLTPRLKQVHDLRIALAETSHIAFNNAIEGGSFASFKEGMNHLVVPYFKLYQTPFWIRVKRKIIKILLGK